MNLSQVKRFFKWAIPILAFLTAISHFFVRSGLNFLVMIFILLVVCYMMVEQLPRIERSIRRELKSIERTLIRGFKLETPVSSAEKEEEEIRTSGVDAFGEMIIGSTLGLPFGLIGVIIGGVIGAIIGESYERKRIKEERKAERRI